ncbi:hypothetical protein D3C72_1280630 [compost metagenome]
MGELDGGLGRHRMTRHQMFAHGVAGQGHQPLGHRQRQDLTIGDGGHDLGGLTKPVDDHTQGRFGNVGVVVGRQRTHRQYPALGRQNRRHVAGHAMARGHGVLTHHRTGAHDLDQVVIGKDRRTGDDGQGDAIHVGDQTTRHLSRHQVGGLQRHRQGSAHQFGRIIGHNDQDLLRRRAIRLVQRHPVDASAQLVRRRRALVFRIRLDQAPDVAFRQSGAVGGHARSS